MSATSVPTPDPTSIPWNDYVNTQSFNVTGLDGTPVTLSLVDIDQLLKDYTTDGTVSGFATGFCAMLLIVLFLITPAKRRRQPICLLNILSLFLLIIKTVCASIVSNASYSGVGPQLLGALYGYGKSTWVPIIIQAIIQPFLYASIMSSLLLQVRVVFAMEPLTRKIITIIGIVAIVVEVGFTVTNSVYSIIVQYKFPAFVPKWIYRTMRLYFLVFVGISCLIFLSKVGLVIYRRRKMGLNVNHFGPIQIIFITFTQCLIVPRIILIVN